MIGMSTGDSLPTDLASAYAMILAQRAALLEAQTEAQHRALPIEKLKFNRQVAARGFGQSSERGAILDQLELQLARPGGERGGGAHVFTAEHIHADETTVPVLAKG